MVWLALRSPQQSLYKDVPSVSLMSQALPSCPLFLARTKSPHISSSSPSAPMATKTQATTAFLLLNLIFCPFASGQLPNTPLITCVPSFSTLLSCRVLIVLIRLGLGNTTSTPCCSFFTNLTSAQAIQYLCNAAKLHLLTVNDVRVILTACGQPVPNPLCP